MSERADGIVITGDVYGSSEPDGGSVDAFDAFLACAADICPVYIVAGENDPAEGLVFTGSIMRQQEVFVSGPSATEVVMIRTEDEFGPLVMQMLPSDAASASVRCVPDPDTGVRNVLIGRRPANGLGTEAVPRNDRGTGLRHGETGSTIVSLVRLDGNGATAVEEAEPSRSLCP